MKVKVLSTTFVVLLALTACSAVTQTSSDRYLNVYKDAQKKQCFSQGVALIEMEKELEQNGITVKCSERKKDGLMYPQACGQNEGTINVYQISESDLEKAKALGFADVKEIKSAKIQLNCK